MNIFELLSFDFVEFVTSPAGILIVVGILLLIVGIRMFLKDGKAAPTAEPSKEEPAPEVKAEEPPAPVEPVENKEAVVEPVAEEKPVEAAPIVVETEGDGVKEVAVEPLAETINFTESVETPAVEPATPAVENLEAPVVEPVAPAVETLDEPAPAIYGGASPEVSTEVLEEKPREIYGGANPLENTAPIPTIPAKEEVSAPVEASPAVEPVAEPAAPVVEPVQPEVVEEKKEELEKLEF